MLSVLTKLTQLMNIQEYETLPVCVESMQDELRAKDTEIHVLKQMVDRIQIDMENHDQNNVSEGLLYSAYCKALETRVSELESIVSEQDAQITNLHATIDPASQKQIDESEGKLNANKKLQLKLIDHDKTAFNTPKNSRIFDLASFDSPQLI
jgi:uncharacterized coiled-coil protein SlyX